MPVRVNARNRVFVITASGDLDLVSRALLDAAVDYAIMGDWSVIAVDLGELHFIDVVGAEPLHRLTLTISDRTILIVNCSPTVDRHLRLFGLGDWVVAVEQLPSVIDDELADLLRLG